MDTPETIDRDTDIAEMKRSLAQWVRGEVLMTPQLVREVIDQLAAYNEWEAAFNGMRELHAYTMRKIAMAQRDFNEALKRL
jgi:hypothetical protein